MKCDACGAPVEKGKCTYCGKIFENEEMSGKYKRPTQTTIINNFNGQNVGSHKYSRPGSAEINKKRVGCGTYIIIFIIICVIASGLSQCGSGNSDSSTNNTEAEAESKSVWATEYASIDDFDYYIDGTELYLKNYNGKDKKVRISSTYEIEGATYNVVSLDGTFALKSVDSVVVPEGVRYVSNNVFNSCGIEFVYIPSTLEEINSSFLGYFHDVEKIYYGGSEEQWNEKVSSDRSEIDAKQIVYDANPDEL
jgi:hypothetical protein